MTKKEIKAAFREHKIQLAADVVNLIEDNLKRAVTKMAQRCKDGNVKRLTPDLFWVALGNWSN